MNSKRNNSALHDGFTENVWPCVYNMSGVDMILFAATLLSRHVLGTQPFAWESMEGNDPVNVAIEWLKHKIVTLKPNDDGMHAPASGAHSHNSATLLVPPTLPLRMQGRVGIIEYEQQDAERLHILRERKRKRQTEKHKDDRKNEEREDASLSSSSEEESFRPKRARRPSSKYNDKTFILHTKRRVVCPSFGHTNTNLRGSSASCKM